MRRIGLASVADLKALACEASSQATTNPPPPTLGAKGGSPAAASDPPSNWDRFKAVNREAGRSVGASVIQFIHHPLASTLPAIVNGVQASIQPIMHPDAAVREIGAYFRLKGPVDGISQAAYTVTNVGTVGAIAVGIAAASVACVASRCHLTAAARQAMVFRGPAFKAIGMFSAASLVANTGQFVFDEAQAAAPEKGVRLAKGIPIIGGVQIFHPTTRKEQVELVKFDVLNIGGSMLTLGIDKLHEHVHAPHSPAKTVQEPGNVHPDGPKTPLRRHETAAPSALMRALGKPAVSYSAMGVVEVSILAAQTPSRPTK
jgi:hypothetical protein